MNWMFTCVFTHNWMFSCVFTHNWMFSCVLTHNWMFTRELHRIGCLHVSYTELVVFMCSMFIMFSKLDSCGFWDVLNTAQVLYKYWCCLSFSSSWWSIWMKVIVLTRGYLVAMPLTLCLKSSMKNVSDASKFAAGTGLWQWKSILIRLKESPVNAFTTFLYHAW